MKKTASIFLCFLIFLSVISTPANAITNLRDTSFEESLAKDLKTLGLFKGVSDTNFDLNRAPSREEAIVMLIRMLGKETEVFNESWSHPFTDVSPWADNYIGYAYEEGLTNGISSTQFGSGEANAAQYLSFVLRALGYSDLDGLDFTWSNPFILANRVGVLPSCVNTSNFLRADVVSISYASLSAHLKGDNQTLAKKLIYAGVFTQKTYDSSYKTDVFTSTPGTDNDGKELTAQQISQKCSPAVFYIQTYSFNGDPRASGSGFFISSMGLAITNHHVVANSAHITIKAQNKTIFDDVSILAVDKANDLALLKVNGTGLPYLEMGDSSSINQGQQVYAIGSPFGLENTISQGIISNTKRTISGIDYIQISVPINHGSSGGALLDNKGSVIGVTTAGLNTTGDLNFAVPINKAKLLNKNSADSLVSWSDEYYPGFSQALDFGAFSGVNLISSVKTPLGYALQYDAFDFHDIADLSSGDCYAHTVFYYYRALLEQGFKQVTEIDSFLGVFETKTETLKISVDLYNSKSISVEVSRKPESYTTFSQLPDFGKYSNMGLDSGPYFVDGSTMYSYKWIDYYYNADDFMDVLFEYFNVLEHQGYKYIGNSDLSYLFEGNKLSVVFGVDNRMLYVDILPI